MYRTTILVSAFLLLAGCTRSERVRLELDFSAQPKWCYHMEVRVVVGDSSAGQPTGSNAARSLLCLHPVTAEPGHVQLAFNDLTIESNIMSTAEAEHVRWSLSDKQIRFRLAEGMLTPVDTTLLSEMQFGGWDLHRTLLRTIPPLPLAAVAVGERWEREHVLPLQSALGPAEAHLYQVFTLDSVGVSPDGVRLASLSWTFTYRVRQLDDTLPPAPQAFRSGAGAGQAVIDLTARALREAAVTFRVPSDQTLARGSE
jgi:hypothetical protein